MTRMNENSNEFYDLDHWLEEQNIFVLILYVQLCYNIAKIQNFIFVCRILRGTLLDTIFDIISWDFTHNKCLVYNDVYNITQLN